MSEAKQVMPIPSGKPYYALRSNGDGVRSFDEVPGIPVTIATAPELDVFVYRDAIDHWHACEGMSGLSLGRDEQCTLNAWITEKSVVAYAKRVVKKRKDEIIRKVLQAVRDNGLSPRYGTGTIKERT